MLTFALTILALLTLATLLVRYRLSVNTSPELLNNQKRIRTWWVICLICIPTFYIGGWALSLLIYALIYLAFYELSRLQDLRINFVRFLLLTLVIVSYDFVVGRFPDQANVFFVIPVLILFASLFFSHSTGTRALFVLLFCIASLHSLQLISQLSNQYAYDSGLIILFLVFITSANDIFQYLCGKLLGHKQLAPGLSPNKTIEGALGGIFFTGLIFALVLPQLVAITWFEAIIIGVLVSMLGILGDLYFSFFKRLVNAKDSGTLMPGHGGLLDRIDSLTLTAPGFGFCLYVVT